MHSRKGKKERGESITFPTGKAEDCYQNTTSYCPNIRRDNVGDWATSVTRTVLESGLSKVKLISSPALLSYETRLE